MDYLKRKICYFTHVIVIGDNTCNNRDNSNNVFCPTGELTIHSIFSIRYSSI